MANVTGSLRVESFPFDSKADGYDADGYPVYDRAVGALTLRTVFKQFFTDGVFGTPADALQISKGDGGLKVNVAPGVFIIRGAMARVGDGDEPVTLTLSDTPPQGNVAYGIMLHYDENDTASIGRSLSLVAVAGEASSNPQPPAPDQSTPGIYEYRLGYVTVPSGATDLSAAVVTNEKGLATCPYAAPFDEIDLSEIVADARAQAQETTDAFLHYAQQYYDLVASAIDDTTAGMLMEMINNINAYAFVDNVTTMVNAQGKIEVKDNGLDGSKIQNYAISQNHLDNFLRQKLGLLDPSSWDFDEFYEYVTGLDTDDDKNEFISGNLDPTIVSGWTAAEIVQMDAALPTAGGKAMCDYVDVNARSWADLHTISAGVRTSSLAGWVDREKTAAVTGRGSVPMRIVGVGVRQTPGGDTVNLMFMAWNSCGSPSGLSDGNYDASGLKAYVEGTVFNSLPSDLRSVMVEVSRYYVDYMKSSDQAVVNFSSKIFPLCLADIYGPGKHLSWMDSIKDILGPGPQVQHFASVSTNDMYSTIFNTYNTIVSSGDTQAYYIPLGDYKSRHNAWIAKAGFYDGGSDSETARIDDSYSFESSQVESPGVIQVNPCFCI